MVHTRYGQTTVRALSETNWAAGRSTAFTMNIPETKKNKPIRAMPSERSACSNQVGGAWTTGESSRPFQTWYSTIRMMLTPRARSIQPTREA